MSVKHGPVTLLSVVQTADGRLQFLTAQGQSVPGPILEIGNANSRYRFPFGGQELPQSLERARTGTPLRGRDQPHRK
jgi:L-arabinose isomerase